MTRRVGFAVLCVLAGSGWLLDEVAPGLLHGLVRMAVHDGLLAVVFGLVSRADRGAGGVARRLWLEIGLTGVAMFALPQIVFGAAGGSVSGTTELLVFLLVPVVVVFVVSQQGSTFGSDDHALRFLAPALAGLLGAILTVPYYLPASLAGRLWFAGIVASAVLAGFAAVRLHRLLQGVGVWSGAAVVFGSASVVALAFCWIDWSGNPGWDARLFAGEVARVAAVEAPLLLLTVWLMREMQPIRFSSRVLFVPLVMIVEGYIIERPSLDWTTVLGVVLLACGAVGLLRADSA